MGSLQLVAQENAGWKQKILRRDSKNTQKNYTEKIFMTKIIMMCDHSPRARHPGM